MVALVTSFPHIGPGELDPATFNAILRFRGEPAAPITSMCGAITSISSRQPANFAVRELAIGRLLRVRAELPVRRCAATVSFLVRRAGISAACSINCAYVFP